MTTECPEIFNVVQGEHKVLTFQIFDENDEPSDLSSVNEIQLFLEDANGSFIRLLKTTLSVAEISKVTTVADDTGDLNDKFFFYDTPNNKYVFHFNIGGTGVDPNIEGRQSVEVTESLNATANEIATALQLAADALKDVTATVLSAVATLNADKKGATDDVVDAPETADQTVFTFATSVQGVDGGPTVVTGTHKVQQILTKNITKLLKVGQLQTALLFIDFDLPTGRKAFKLEKAYNVCETKFELA